MNESQFLSRGLCWSAHLAGAGLLLVVALAPWLVAFVPANSQSQRFLDVFARDVVVRRTAMASAVGLFVTARVFFRRKAEVYSEPLVDGVPIRRLR